MAPKLLSDYLPQSASDAEFKLAERLFKKFDAKLATQIKRDDKENGTDNYGKIREVAVANGMLGPTERQRIRAAFEKFQPKPLTEAQLRAMAENSLEDCKKWFKNPDNDPRFDLSELYNEDRERYDRLRLAAIAHGIPIGDPAPREEVKDREEIASPVADELAAVFNLPKGFRATPSQVNRMLELSATLKAEQVAKKEQESAQKADAAEVAS